MDQVDVAAPLEEPLGQIEDVAPAPPPQASVIINTLIARPLPGAATSGHASVHGRTVGSGPGPSAGRPGCEAGNQRKTVAHRYPPGWNENGFRAATPHSPAPGRRREAGAVDRHPPAHKVS